MATHRAQLLAEIQDDLKETKRATVHAVELLLTERGPRIDRAAARARELRDNALGFRYSAGCIPAWSRWLDELDTWLWYLERRAAAILDPSDV